jgi:methyltransferase (TIGR00027 family)
MSAGRPSLAARWSAAGRARLEATRPSTPGGDVQAEHALDESLRGRLGLPLGHATALKERTRFLDNEVAGALGQGLTQVVSLGAGYDGRALRFGGAARWFEVDRPDIQADKRQRLATQGLSTGATRFIALDLMTQDLGPALEAAGHEAGRPTLFIAEELFPQLTLDRAAMVCQDARDRAAPGSVLAATLDAAPDTPGRGGLAVRGALDQLRKVAGERRRYEFLDGDAQKLYVVTGWRVLRTHATPPGLLGQGFSRVALAGEPALR